MEEKKKKKKGNCLRFPDYPLRKPISCLKVLKESSSNINNIDYHPTVLFSLPPPSSVPGFESVQGWKAEVAASPVSAICLGKC